MIWPFDSAPSGAEGTTADRPADAASDPRHRRIYGL